MRIYVNMYANVVTSASQINVNVCTSLIAELSLHLSIVCYCCAFSLSLCLV